MIINPMNKPRYTNSTVAFGNICLHVALCHEVYVDRSSLPFHLDSKCFVTMESRLAESNAIAYLHNISRRSMLGRWAIMSLVWYLWWDVVWFKQVKSWRYWNSSSVCSSLLRGSCHLSDARQRTCMYRCRRMLVFSFRRSAAALMRVLKWQFKQLLYHL